MKRFLFLATALLALSSMSIAQVIDPALFTDKGGMGEKNLKKAPKKVYIASFAGYFHVAEERTASSTGGRQVGGGSYSGDTKTHMAIAIDNIDSEDFVAIVDKAYDQFTAGLKEQGYEILTADAAAGTEYYDGWIKKSGGQISSAQLRGYAMAAPTGYEYFVKKENKNGKTKTNTVDKTMLLSKQLDDAIVADVSFVFKAIDIDAKGGLYSGGSKVKAEIDFRVVPQAVDGTATSNFVKTQVKFVHGKGPGLSAKAISMNSIKKEVPIEGVFTDTKFKESTRAAVTNLSTSPPDYYGFVLTESRSTEVTHTAAADHDLYVEKTVGASSQVIDYALSNLKNYAGN